MLLPSVKIIYTVSGELIDLCHIVQEPVLLGEHSNGVRFLEV